MSSHRQNPEKKPLCFYSKQKIDVDDDNFCDDGDDNKKRDIYTPV